MKTISLILSIIVLFTSGYFFAYDFRQSSELNYLIYMSLLAILMTISVVGILMNTTFILQQREKIDDIFSESNFSKIEKEIKNS